MRKLPIILFLICLAVTAKAQHFNLLGSAEEPQPRRASLVQGMNSQGAAWLNQPISLNADFDVLFSINFGCAITSNDGFAFLISQSPNLSTLQGGLGFKGLHNNIAIEFDLKSDPSDPLYEHADIFLNGETNHNSIYSLVGAQPLSPTSSTLKDCNYHDVKMSWQAATKKLALFVDCQLVLEHTFTNSQLLQAFQSPNNLHIGFTGSNGTGQANYVIDWVNATFGLEEKEFNICRHDTVYHEFTGGTYTFDTPSGLMNSSSSTVAFFQQQNEQVLVSATNACGDSWSETVDVKVFNQPALDLGEDTAVCIADTLWLDVSQPDITHYQWSTGHNGPQLAPYQTGEYSVTVSNQACEVSDTMHFERITIPEITLGNDTSICYNAHFIENAGSTQHQYNWNTGNISNLQEITMAGVYMVTATNACGSSSDTLNVTTIPRINVELGADTVTCLAQPLVLNANSNAATGYTWNTGANQPSIQVQTSGNYEVSVSNNCETVTDNLNVTVLDKPDLSAFVDTFYCEGSSITFSPPSDADQYSWKSEGSAPLQVTKPGIYKISAQNKCGESESTFSVIELTPPHFDLGQDTVLCEGQSLTVDLTIPFTDFLWNDGDTSPTKVLNQDGLYSVSVYNSCGGSSDNIRIEYDHLPMVNLPNEYTICEGESVTIVAEIQDVREVVWNTGTTNINSISVNQGGQYAVEVANHCGTAKDSTRVNIETPTALDLDADSSLCPGEYVQVDLSHLEGTIYWSNGNTGSIGMLQSPGKYSVEYTNQFGCISSDSVILYSECPTKLFMPTAFTPNGDFLNDVFKPEGEWVKSFSMKVFNRWGEMVHESVGFDNGWNGYNQPTGVYVWHVTYENESAEILQLQGKVTLMR